MCAPGVHGGSSAPVGSARVSATTPSATVSACLHDQVRLVLPDDGLSRRHGLIPSYGGSYAICLDTNDSRRSGLPTTPLDLSTGPRRSSGSASGNVTAVRKRCISRSPGQLKPRTPIIRIQIRLGPCAPC